MIDSWSAFAHSGDPNGPGRPRSPEFAPNDTVTDLSTSGISPTPHAEIHQCVFWASLPR